MWRHSQCTLARERLHGYLDGALSEAESRKVAAHLPGCAQCREELAELRTLKAALRSVGPADSDSAAVQARVFARFRDAGATPAGAPARPALLNRVSAGWWNCSPSVSLGLAAATAALVAFLVPVGSPVGKASILPGPGEMSLLSQRHDVHVSHAEEEPAPREQPANPGGGLGDG